MKLTLLSAAVLLMAAAGAAQAAKIATITVEAGKAARCDTPVCAALDGIDAPKTVHLEEVAAGGRTPVACQIEPGKPARLWFILAGKTAAGATRTFELVEGPAAAAPAVDVKADKDFLDITSGGAKVLRFYNGLSDPPAAFGPLFKRSGFIGPVYTPSGLLVTDTHPSNHKHHMGIWSPWTKTEFEGRHPDFWNLGTGSGLVRCTGVTSTISGPIFGGFVSTLEQVDTKAPGGEKVALNETWDVKVYRVGGVEKAYWLFDFISTQRCAGASPLKLPKYHYGGLGIRGARAWEKDVPQLLTSEGKTRKQANETTMRWADLYGPLDGKTAGILLMSHPANFRYPEPIRMHPSEPFLGVAPQQGGDFAIEPGKDYVWRYRFAIHDGEMKADEANRLWADFGEPPAVKVAK